jgi:hypothetical protein
MCKTLARNINPGRDSGCFRGFWLELVAQIEFLEWTESDHLRHSKCAGLRDDKVARSIRKEPEAKCSRSQPPRGSNRSSSSRFVVCIEEGFLAVIQQCGRQLMGIDCRGKDIVECAVKERPHARLRVSLESTLLLHRHSADRICFSPPRARL